MIPKILFPVPVHIHVHLLEKCAFQPEHHYSSMPGKNEGYSLPELIYRL